MLYHWRAWENIKKTWNKELSYEFGFWGVNDNSDALLKLINDKYPNAKLVDVFDLFKKIKAYGIESKHPLEVGKRVSQSNYYIIVTAYLASRVANDIFEKCGFDISKAFLCERDFVTKNDL